MSACRLIHRETKARCEKDRGHRGNHYGYSHYPGQVVSWEEIVRIDALGRRIGYNWWREHNVSEWFWANAAWERAAEAASLGYATELAEYAASHPRPTLKDFLVANAGMSRVQAA